jgi:hypothetical protein
MDNYSYECPRCGTSVGANVVPIGGPPTCSNYSGHHSKKSFDMVYVPSKSKKEEPNPYPKSKKKVIYT